MNRRTHRCTSREFCLLEKKDSKGKTWKGWDSNLVLQVISLTTPQLLFISLSLVQEVPLMGPWEDIGLNLDQVKLIRRRGGSFKHVLPPFWLLNLLQLCLPVSSSHIFEIPFQLQPIPHFLRIYYLAPLIPLTCEVKIVVDTWSDLLIALGKNRCIRN